jgi:hypothetical protein
VTAYETELRLSACHPYGFVQHCLVLYHATLFPPSRFFLSLPGACEYDVSNRTSHSPLVGVLLDGRGLYGRWEANATLPILDACNGHYGSVPATTIHGVTYPAATNVYHYHITKTAPFVAACFGPVANLTVAAALYPGCATPQSAATCTSLGWSSDYRLMCPPVRDHLGASWNSLAPNASCPVCTGDCTAPTPSQSRSVTQSATMSPSQVTTPSQSQSVTRSQSISPTQTHSQSQTATQTRSQTRTTTSSPSQTRSQTQSPTQTVTTGLTPTATSSQSASASESGTPSVSLSQSSTASQSVTSSSSVTMTLSQFMSGTHSQSATETCTRSQMITLSSSPSQNATSSQSRTSSFTPSLTKTQSSSPSQAFTSSQTPSETASPSLTSSPSYVGATTPVGVRTLLNAACHYVL